MDVACQAKQQQCFLIYHSIHTAFTMQTVSWYCIISSLLNPFDMSVLRAEWCVPGSTYLVCTDRVQAQATAAALVSHLRLEDHLLASCINSYDSSRKLPLFRRAWSFLIFLMLGKVIEVNWPTIFSPVGQTKNRAHRVKCERQNTSDLFTWPCFSNSAHIAVTLVLRVIIWVISRDTTSCSPWWEAV